MILVGLLAWYVIRLVKHLSDANDDPETGYERAYGIGEFIDLIIFYKAAIAPVVAIYTISTQLIAVEEAPGFVAVAGWSDYKFYFVMVLVVVQLANWWVAYGLATRFCPASARNAKILFFVTPFVPVLDYFMGKSMLGFSSPINVLIDFAGSFALSIVLFSYFTLSARIKEIYLTPPGKNGKRPVVRQKKAVSLAVDNVRPPANSGADVFELRKPGAAFSEFKKCPYCAEDIRPDAVKCRYCLSELSASGG